jgi:tRNA A37 methylthiotransferase MiaB
MKHKVGLVQLNSSFSGQNYFPYSVGLLQAYALKNCTKVADYEFIDPLYKRISVERAVDHLKDCSVVGFSAYVWNERLSVKIAMELKKISPHVLIVFGGPQVPNNAEEFFKKYPYIDLTVHGEGEYVFSQILEHYETKDWENISSISYIQDGEYKNNQKARRFLYLDNIPSPYLDGTFDQLMTNNPDEQWLALWETNRGCPFSCTYCDWGSATQAKVSQFTMERLKKEVEWFANHKLEFVFCCDANYGILPRDLEITQWMVDSKKTKGYPKALSVQNTKNATERAYQVQKLLASEGLNKGVTLSVQSMDSVTLKNVKRDNISLESYQELQRRFMKDGIETYSDMILAMPGETYESFVDGMDKIISNGQHNRIQFNNLSILPNAEMGNPEYQKKFGMVSVNTNIINFHGSLDDGESEDIREKQQLVIATDTMPWEDWLKTRAFCWMAGFLHFDKILQIPIIVTHRLAGIRYRDIFSAFMDPSMVGNYTILKEIRQCFIDKAIDIQNGGAEYCEAKDWLGIWWPADEYIFIKLSVEHKIQQFYDEAHKMLLDVVAKYGKTIDENALADAIFLNRHLLKLPFLIDDTEIVVGYDVMKFYKQALISDSVTLEKVPTVYKIERSKAAFTDWQKWYKEVVWYGNKKGAYLHGNYKTEYQLSGHY